MRTLLVRYAAWVRATVCVACLVLGSLVVPAGRMADQRWVTIPAMLALAAWNALAVRRATRAVIAADTALLCLAAVTQQWTVPDWAAADSTGWILAVLTVAGVTLQWFTRPWTGALGVAAFLAAYLTGAFWAVGAAELDRIFMLLWLVPQALLSRICVELLLAAARRADAVDAEQQAARIAAAVNAARRADEREQQALLHDTVAATLLMVGVGAVEEPSGWLAEQAGRDLKVLDHAAAPPPDDLAELLRQEISRSTVRVTHDHLPELLLQPDRAAAIAGSVREALTNVRRHSGTDEASLTVGTSPLRITIADRGRGFTPPASPSPYRRGITGSIRARVEAAGGRADVTSEPGRGTVVALEWPDD